MLSASAAAVGRVAHHIGAGCRRSGTRSAPRAYVRGVRASPEALGAWGVAARRGGSVGDCRIPNLASEIGALCHTFLDIDVIGAFKEVAL